MVCGENAMGHESLSQLLDKSLGVLYNDMSLELCVVVMGLSCCCCCCCCNNAVIMLSRCLPIIIHIHMFNNSQGLQKMDSGTVGTVRGLSFGC